MKRKIVGFSVGIAVALSTLALPGYSATILAFSGNTTGGTVTVNGSNIVTGISTVPYSDLVVGPNLYALSLGLLNLSGNTLELDGEIPSLEIDSSIALVDIQLASALTNTGGASVLNVSINSATSITESATLLSDLGITGPVTSTLVGGGLIGSGSSGSFDVTSDTLTVGVTPSAVPEPVMLPVSGICLVGIVWFARRRSFQEDQALRASVL